MQFCSTAPFGLPTHPINVYHRDPMSEGSSFCPELQYDIPQRVTETLRTDKGKREKKETALLTTDRKCLSQREKRILGQDLAGLAERSLN